MALGVDIIKLYILAEKLEKLEGDLYSLSNTAVSASNSVLERTNVNGSEALVIAYKKAVDSTKQAKNLYVEISDELTRQTELLRKAAYNYRVHDRIEKVNN